MVDLGGGYAVAEVPVTAAPELGPRSLRGLDVALEDLKLLGVRQQARDGDLLAEPPADLDLAVGDSLVVFGPREKVDLLAGP